MPQQMMPSTIVAPMDQKSVVAIEKLIGQSIAWADEPPASAASSVSESEPSPRHSRRRSHGKPERSGDKPARPERQPAPRQPAAEVAPAGPARALVRGTASLDVVAAQLDLKVDLAQPYPNEVKDKKTYAVQAFVSLREKAGKQRFVKEPVAVTLDGKKKTMTTKNNRQAASRRDRVATRKRVIPRSAG